MTTSVKILAVDDVPDNLLILESLLGDIDGYQIDCVYGGKAALAAVKECPPDLILLDVMMPDLDGYEVTRRIRSDETLPYIPILLVTAHDRSSLAEGLDSGADDFIRKPFDINELTARVRSLLRLKRSIDEQAAMIRQRDDFVARLTHDLRTPLVAANRVLSLCIKGTFGKLPTQVKEAIENIITSNENLLQMANTLLQVYRHEAGQKKLVKSSVSLYALTKQVIRELKPLADEKQIGLNLEAQPPDGDSDTKLTEQYETEGDRLELRRLLTNLLGNAIKFTDEGSVSVQLAVSANAPAEIPAAEAIQVTVKDTGIGIKPEMQEKIFEWYVQGDSMRAGSGLGLHLSKRIADLHQGTLTLESEVGRGSAFTLSLPKLQQGQGKKAAKQKQATPVRC